jgi:hypothetical protein
MTLRARVSALTVVAVALLGFGPAANAATQVGFKAHSYEGFNAETQAGAITGQKPESKLWYLDGKWWAVMLSPTNNGAHTIWRLDPTAWVNTGVVVDGRAGTKEDVLQVGNAIYITSRSAGASNLLRRFNYSNGVYTLAAGFPVSLPTTGPETLTVARDSLGALWITYELNNNIYVAHTQASETSMGSAFVIPVTGASGVAADDISSIISFTDATGPAIGVMWSNQVTDEDYFAVHRDGASDATWTVETVLSGGGAGTLGAAHVEGREAEDHINLKTVEGRVYAAVKTGQKVSGAALIKLLVRSTSGAWSSHAVATVAQGNTRPVAMLEVDPAKRLIYIFMSLGEGTSARGIFYKVSQMDSVSFPTQATPFIQGPNDEPINDATSMKANTNETTGIVVLASDGKNYWWNRLGGGPAGVPPTAVAGSAATNEDNAVNITLTGNDADTCDLIFSVATSPAHGSLGPVTNQACTPGSPNTDRATVVYTPVLNYAGPDSFTFTVNDGTTTSSPATVSVTVTAVADPPTASPGSANTTTNTPVTVTLNGTDPDTCSLTFAVTQAPTHGSLGALTNQACTAGSPNTDRATVTYTPAGGFTGSDALSFTANDGTTTSPAATITINVGSGSSGITLRSSSSGVNAVSTSLTIPAPAGVSSGDVMVAGISVRGTTTVTPPSGWTLVRLDASSGDVIRQAVYVKAAAFEPANYTWTIASPQAAAGGIVAFAGVDTQNPVNVHSGMVVNSVRMTTISAPSVTTTVNGAMLIGFFGMASNTTIAPPSGMSERYDVASNGGAYFVTSEASNVLQVSAGATGNKTATAGTAGYNIGQLVALRPA